MVLVPPLFYRKAYFLLLAGIAFFLPFPMVLANTVTGLLVLLWLLDGRLPVKLKIVYAAGIPLLFISLFAVQAIGLIYTSNMKAGLFQLEKSLSLLFFPLIIFSSPPLSSRRFKWILAFFVFGCLVAMASSLIWALYRRFILQIMTQVEINNFFIDLPRFHGLTHVYFGLYLALAFFISIYLYREFLIKRNQYFWFVLAILCSFFAFSLVSTGTMAFFALVLVSFIVGWWLVEDKKEGIKYLFYVIPFLFLGGYFFYTQTFLGERVRQRLTYSFDRIENNPYDYSATRMGPLKSTLSLLENNWLFGLGTGDAGDAMADWFKQNDLHLLAGFNSHNQYLGIMLFVGIPGLSIFIFSLFYPLFLSMKFGLYLYGCFLILFILCSFSENLLETNKGIVFYAFFNSLFARQWLSPDKKLAIEITQYKNA